MTDATSFPDSHIPDLRIVAIDRLLPHETHDESRLAPLMRRLPEDGILMNPPIVTEVSDNHFVILDGANRIAALEGLQYEHALVQVIPYAPPVVELRTWYHVVSGVGASTLLQRFSAIPQLAQIEADLSQARALLAERAILVYLVTAEHGIFTLAASHLDLRARTRLLAEIVQVYLHDGRLDRANTDDIEEIRAMYPDMSLAVVFPHYTSAEIIELALEGVSLPPGISRHLVNGRALRLNYPLARLKSPRSLAEKNAELTGWVQQRFAQRGVRFYAESTYMFDE